MARPKSAHPSARTRGSSAANQLLGEKSASFKRKESLERLLEEEDDLEFTVSFPSPCPGLTTVFEEEEPVVFILGWEGAGDADLARYARMYESWGCVTLSYAAPGRALYMAGQGAELVNIAARLAALTTELCVGENPVMVHCLGLNSISVYNHIRETLSLSTNIAGVIFEGVSLPGLCDNLSGLWRSVRDAEPEPGLVSLVTAVLRMAAHLAYNLLMSWPSQSALRRAASTQSPPSLHLMARVEK